MAFSIGQTDYNSAGPGGSVSQGNQQPYEIANGIQQAGERNALITVYPNPASDFIVIHSKDHPGAELVYELFDQQGKLLLSAKMTSEQAIVSFENLPNATYFLKVSERGKVISSFSIIKNK